MRVLVTGSAGFLGYHLCEVLLQNGHDVLGVDNFSGGDRFNHQALKIRWGSRYTFVEHNLLLKGSTQEIFDNYKPEVVYHGACHPHEGLSSFSPHLITDSVLGMSARVFAASINAGVKRIVYMSSMARYGEQERVPFTEDMTPKPVDPYGWAKYAAEGMLKSLAKAHGFEYNIVIPHNIYGPHQKYDDQFRNVAAIMCNRVLKGQQPKIYGDGTQKRCFSYVSDLMVPLLEVGLSPGIVNETFNFGPDAPFITINELAEKVCKMAHIDFKPIYLPGRPNEVKHANCSADKLKKRLNVQFNTSLEAGLWELYSYINKRGPKQFNHNLPIEIESKLTPSTWVKGGMNE